MNLQENINRIKTLMSESKEERIKNTIAQHGLYYTIKLMGGYEPILNSVGHEYFTNEDKIKFILKVFQYLSDIFNSSAISIHYDLGMVPIRVNNPKKGDNLLVIDYMNSSFVTIDVYSGEKYDLNIGSFTRYYKELDDNTLDNLFIFMIDILEHYK